ncbi:MAG: hypothetical protein IT365_09360 [Candidatus Hydrogenedentes bacterium]|nr:hypothetical protein [Candidatus Hydrogenedentota bacterium]
MNATDLLNRIHRSYFRRLRSREYRRLLQGMYDEPVARAWLSWEAARKLMSLPALALLLLVLWYFATVPDARLTAERNLAAQANVTRPVEHDSPVYAMASALATRGWNLIQCDGVPVLYAPPYEAYRVLLRYTFKMDEEAGGCVLPITKRMHMDLLFFPAEESVSREIKSHIHWEDVEQRQPSWMDAEGPVETFDLGEVQGYHVCGRMTVPQQALVRRVLGLKGGDDHVALIESRLAQCSDSRSYWRTLRLLKDCGPEAIPVIERALETGRYRSRGWLMEVLFHMPGDESWRILEACYQQPETRRLFTTVLSENPPDPHWKHAYLRMIEGDPSETYVTVGLDAAAAFAWQESLPAIARVKAAPQSIGQYVNACKAERAIEGNPLSSDLDEAACNIRVMDEFRRMRNASLDLGQPGCEHIIQCGDAEGAVLTAINIAATQAEGPFSSADNTGIALLLRLPRETVLSTLRHLAAATKDERSRSEACEILDAVLTEGATIRM